MLPSGDRAGVLVLGYGGPQDLLWQSECDGDTNLWFWSCRALREREREILNKKLIAGKVNKDIKNSFVCHFCWIWEISNGKLNKSRMKPRYSFVLCSADHYETIIRQRRMSSEQVTRSRDTVTTTQAGRSSDKAFEFFTESVASLQDLERILR